MRASLRRRQRPIRVLLASIFIVPLVSLLALWGFAASVTLSNAIQEHNFTSEDNLYGSWAQTLFNALATEREDAFMYLCAGRMESIATYQTQEAVTNKAVAMFEQGLAHNATRISPSAGPALVSFKAELAWLQGRVGGTPGIRPEVAAGTVSALTAFNDYNQIIDSEFQLYSDLVIVNNTPLYMQAVASVEAGRAVEMASREATLVAGAVMQRGQMSKPERVLFAQVVAERQLLMSDALKELQPSIGSGYQRVDESTAYKNFTEMENTVIGSIGERSPLPITGLQVLSYTVPLFNKYGAAEQQDRVALSSLGTSIGNKLLAEVAIAGGVGLIAVVLSVFFMVGFGRRISRDLIGLQHAALNLAEDRLPSVVARLSQGEDVDVAAEAAPLAGGRIAETARVAAAFSSVQRTAVEAAVGQARLRRGVSQVFRNLAWRSQSLLHRQLSLLDAMERTQTEPQMLDQLFQLDHLTTRMRRNAEGLLILSDASPGRGWREPIPVMDVLRGAIAEVEDYKRVSVICNSDDAVVGAAVADVIHLLAELVENGTTYSPASTEVTMRAERVANGFVVEVEDRGIGIGPEEIDAYNERLANPPEFDLADSDQLGLFVVARLAGKHKIKVTLRRSPYGGTNAIVLLPHAIMATADSASTERFDVLHAELIHTQLVRTEMVRTEVVRTELTATTLRDDAPLQPGEQAASLAIRSVEGNGASGGNGAHGGNGASGGNGSSDGSGAHTSLGSPAGNGAADGNGSTNPGPAASGPDADNPLPWLPRRQRQASLAPQLKTGGLAKAAEKSQPDGTDGPSPAGTRALVESLQSGLDRARMTPAPVEDSWPTNSEPDRDGGSWPTSAPSEPATGSASSWFFSAWQEQANGAADTEDE